MVYLGNNMAGEKRPSLPDEIWLRVYVFLGLGDLVRMASVSQRMRRLAKSKTLWQPYLGNQTDLDETTLRRVLTEHEKGVSAFNGALVKEVLQKGGLINVIGHLEECVKKNIVALLRGFGDIREEHLSSSLIAGMLVAKEALAFRGVSDQLKSRKSLVKRVVSINPRMLKHASLQMKDDLEIASIAISRDIFAERYIGEGPCCNKKFAELLVEKVRGSFSNEAFAQEKNVQVIEDNKGVLNRIFSHMSKKERTSVVEDLVSECGIILGLLPKAYARNPEVVNRAIASNPYAIVYAQAFNENTAPDTLYKLFTNAWKNFYTEGNEKERRAFLGGFFIAVMRCFPDSEQQEVVRNKVWLFLKQQGISFYQEGEDFDWLIDLINKDRRLFSQIDEGLRGNKVFVLKVLEEASSPEDVCNIYPHISADFQADADIVLRMMELCSFGGKRVKKLFNKAWRQCRREGNKAKTLAFLRRAHSGFCSYLPKDQERKMLIFTLKAVQASSFQHNNPEAGPWEWVLDLLAIDFSFFQNLREDIKGQERFVESAFSVVSNEFYNGQFKWVSKKLRDKKGLAIALLQKSKSPNDLRDVFKDLSERLRADEEVAIAALRVNISNERYIAPTLLKSRTFAKRVAVELGHYLEGREKDKEKDRELFLEMVKYHPRQAIAQTPVREFIYDREAMLMAVRADGRSILLMPAIFWFDREFIESALENQPNIRDNLLKVVMGVECKAPDCKEPPCEYEVSRMIKKEIDLKVLLEEYALWSCIQFIWLLFMHLVSCFYVFCKQSIQLAEDNSPSRCKCCFRPETAEKELIVGYLNSWSAEELLVGEKNGRKNDY